MICHKHLQSPRLLNSAQPAILVDQDAGHETSALSYTYVGNFSLDTITLSSASIHDASSVYKLHLSLIAQPYKAYSSYKAQWMPELLPHIFLPPGSTV